MKKILIVKNPNTIWKDIALTLKKKYNFTNILWIGTQKSKSFQGTLSYSHEDAILLKDPLRNFKRTRGLNLQEIKLINQQENIFFAMIDRWSIFPKNLAYDDKKNYLINSYLIWKNLYSIKKFKFDGVLCNTIPHRLYDYTLYLFCTYNRIPFVSVDRATEFHVKGWTSNPPYLVNNLKNDKLSILGQKKISLNFARKTFFSLKLINKKTYPSYVLNNLKKKENNFVLLLKYNYLSVYTKYFFYKLFNLKSNTKLLIFNNFSRSQNKLKFANKSEVLMYYFEKFKARKKALKFYYQNAIEKKNYIKKNYIIFGAQKTPERSSVPDGGYYHDVLKIIKLIITALPKNYYLVYKPHPSSLKGNLIDIENQNDAELFKSIKKISKKIIFSSYSNKYELISKSKGVLTLTSNFAWEANLFGKPAGIFGDNTWFKNNNQIYKIKNLKDMREFILRTASNKKINENKKINFFHHVLNNVFHHDIFREKKTQNLKYEKSKEYSKVLNIVCKNFKLRLGK